MLFTAAPLLKVDPLLLYFCSFSEIEEFRHRAGFLLCPNTGWLSGVRLSPCQLSCWCCAHKVTQIKHTASWRQKEENGHRKPRLISWTRSTSCSPLHDHGAMLCVLLYRNCWDKLCSILYEKPHGRHCFAFKLSGKLPV